MTQSNLHLSNRSDAKNEGAAKRILFVMPHGRYLRLYDTTVLELARRGHEVLLAYDKPKKTGDQDLVPHGAPPNLRCIGKVPRHGGPWRVLLTDLGCTINYIRFLSPRKGGSTYLRTRMEKFLPQRFAALTRVRSWPAFVVRMLASLAIFLERAIPVDPKLLEYVREIEPDAVVVTPLVLRGPWGVQQTQLVKATRRLGTPVALAVASWDHLSSKGYVRVDPDMVLMWNDTQRHEAMQMHRIPAARIVVTGAQPFDRWFTATPSRTRDAFLDRAELPRGTQHLLLYVGSSRGIAEPELEMAFVRQWLAALRSSGSAALRNASVLIRPHPFNTDAWQKPAFSHLGDAVSIWDHRHRGFPTHGEAAADYFHSLYYSSAVIGINTSAMIEASIVGRQVYTAQLPEFAATQAGTTHFGYLTPEAGGCVFTSRTMADHIDQLSRGVADPTLGDEARRRFVSEFVRPNGLDRISVEAVAVAIERLATLCPRPVRDRPVALAPVRFVLAGLARRMTAESSPAPRSKRPHAKLSDAS